MRIEYCNKCGQQKSKKYSGIVSSMHCRKCDFDIEFLEESQVFTEKQMEYLDEIKKSENIRIDSNKLDLKPRFLTKPITNSLERV